MISHISHGPAREADVAALAALHAASFTRDLSPDEFAKLLRAPEDSALVARCTGNQCPVGFVIARTVAGEAAILTLAVAPEHRQHGVARTLMQRLFDDFRHRGVGFVFLEVGAENAPALLLYRGFGFAELGRRPGYYGASAPGDALVLRASLAAPAPVSKSAERDYEKLV
jgi:ribosomal-protein-alanine N-acetyltransferase